MMKGWKTWVSIAALVILAFIDALNGDYDAATTKLASAGGLYGVGHKIEKNQP